MEVALEALKGAAEVTRLRILFVLRYGELTVSELTQVLGQSQPRISRHLKLLVDSGLIERRREGSWAFFRLRQNGFPAQLVQFTLDGLSESDPGLIRDVQRLERVRERRAEVAAEYFRENASEWDRLRALHASEDAVEAAARGLLKPAKGKQFSHLLDLGTGTARMLEVFAGSYERAVGFDINQDMLTFARSRLDTLRLEGAELRQGDILALPTEFDGVADAAIVHQVLHFLVDPSLALAEAVRVMRMGGLLLVVDFAPHEVEFLREQHAHRRLGFARQDMERMAGNAGLRARDYVEIAAPADKGDQGLTVSLWLFEKV